MCPVCTVYVNNELSEKKRVCLQFCPENFLLVFESEDGCISLFQGSVFRRLGGKTTVTKRAATSTVTFDDDDDTDIGQPALEYAGVLKESPSKKAKLEAANKLMKNARRTLSKLLSHIV